MLDLLLWKGVNVNLTTDIYTNLQFKEKMKKILKPKWYFYMNNRSAFHLAAKKNYSDIVELLIVNRGNINMKDEIN